jgi:hypothetical protein
MNFLIQLLSSIVSDIVTGKMESTSDRLTHKVWWRYPIYFIIVAAALWVAIASAFLWESASRPGVVGLLDFVGHGGPTWLLSIPVVALLLVIIGSLPVAGRYGLALVFQAALFWLVLVGMANFQADGHSALNLAAVSSFLVTIPAMLLALITALADAPPVTSPMAYLTMHYMGRVGHLRGLLASAKRLGWETRGPEGKARALTISGYSQDRHSVRVVSGVSAIGVSTADQGYWYKVTISSPRPLPSFGILNGKLSPHIAARAITGALSNGQRPQWFYVIPQYGRPLPDGWVERFARQVATGERYVRARRESAQLTSGGILYTSFRMMRLPAKSGEIEPLVDWLCGVAALLEEIAPLIEEVTPYTAGFTSGLPYGQISDVDPTSRMW